MEYLKGHTSQETAYVVDDYPYEQYNKTHEPGFLSDKAEFEEA